MCKKKYITPEMECITIQNMNHLLAGSGMNDDLLDNQFDQPIDPLDIIQPEGFPDFIQL